MKVFFVISLTLILCRAYGQINIDSLKDEDFLSDFDLAVNIIKGNHPNPFKFISEKDFNHKVDSMRAMLVSKPNIYTFYSNSPTNILKDVHLSGSLYEDISTELFKRLSYFPYPVYAEQGRLFVNIKEKEIPFGAEIIAINHIPIKSILRNISSPVDGVNPSVDRISDFGMKLSMRSNNPDDYLVTFLDSSKTEKSLEVAAISPSEYYYRGNKQVYPYNLAEIYLGAIYSEFEAEKKIGKITVNSFDIGEDYAYKEFSRFFKEVSQKKCEKIIIDIRRNSGGSPSIAALLYSFIAKNSFSNLFRYRMNNIKFGFSEYRIDGNGRRLSQQDLEAEANFLYQRFDRDSTGQHIGNSRLMEGVVTQFPKDKDAFGGQVLVLVGSETISAAVYFASLVQKHKRGIIIGKETSSGIDATTAAWFIRYELPKTKTSIIIPLAEIYFFDAVIDRGRGLMPDAEIPFDKFLDYIKRGKDPEMSFALEQ